MERRVIIQNKHYQTIDIISFEDTSRTSLMRANRKLEKYEVFVSNNGVEYNNAWISDQKRFVSYPMRERRDHTIIR